MPSRSRLSFACRKLEAPIYSQYGPTPLKIGALGEEVSYPDDVVVAAICVIESPPNVSKALLGLLDNVVGDRLVIKSSRPGNKDVFSVGFAATTVLRYFSGKNRSGKEEPMTDTDRRALCRSIYYLKVEELRQICAALTVSPRGAKGTLAKRILNAVGVADEDGRAISTGRETRFSRYTGELDPETHILPGHYTNGPKMRAKLRTMIGDHFSFTNYGMEWIRERWLEESYPSFAEFASFWQGEYNRRRAGGEFESLVTNARVRFFRAMEGHGLSRDDLERAWQNERRSHVETVSQILSVTIVE